MGKYNYDKNVLKGLGVGKFLGEVKLRNQKIAEGKDELPQSIFNSNVLAAEFHPFMQEAVIDKIIDRGDAKSFVLKSKDENKKLAYFRAGQYVCVFLDVNGAKLQRPYTIGSNPKDALNKDSTYTLTIKKVNGGFISEYILNNWKKNDTVKISGPLGEFYYTKLRDAKNVIAIAGGSGITPFYSMAESIASGVEDFNLTILYGSRKKDGILLKNELDQVEKKSKGKVKVVHVLSDEKVNGFENGFITADLIKKYAPKGDYSVFVCGPKALYNFMDGELKKLSLTNKRIRYEVKGEFGDPAQDKEYPAEAKGKTFNIKVIARDKEYQISASASETVLVALERAGITAPSHCRSGECGFCRSRLVDGKVFSPKSREYRREADIKFNWIHPCCSYPVSDLTIEVFPIM